MNEETEVLTLDGLAKLLGRTEASIREGIRRGVPWKFGSSRKYLVQPGSSEACRKSRWRRDRDSNPGYVCTHTGFRIPRLQPLGHPS